MLGALVVQRGERISVRAAVFKRVNEILAGGWVLKAKPAAGEGQSQAYRRAVSANSAVGFGGYGNRRVLAILQAPAY